MKLSAAGRNRQQGFSLTELMVVVAIVGALVSAAAIMMRTTQTVQDASTVMANLLREASRKAVAGGPIRADVAANTGIVARTRMVVSHDASDDIQYLTIDRLQESPPPANTASWIEVTRRVVQPPLEVNGFRPSAEVNPGAGPQTLLGTGTTEVRCLPDGSCEAVTMYLRDTVTSEQTRVVVMPLAGAPQVFGSW